MTPPGEDSARDIVGDLPSFSKNYDAEMATAPGPIRTPSFSQASTINITGHTGLHIILPSSASRATSSGAITKLNRCIVDMSVPTASGAPFAGLALKSIKKSLVIAGHVAGPVHITSIEDSIIVVTSRQVRMHECKNVDIYLHCASRPIIEDCSNVRFSPIPNSQVSSIVWFGYLQNTDTMFRMLQMNLLRTSGIRLMTLNGLKQSIVQTGLSYRKRRG